MEENKEVYLNTGFPMDEEFYIRPKTANKKMQVAQTLLQTVYLYGISGCGKTAFICDYLEKTLLLFCRTAECRRTRNCTY